MSVSLEMDRAAGPPVLERVGTLAGLPASVFAHYPHPVALIAPDGAIAATNLFLDRLFGLDHGQALGVRLTDLVSRTDGERLGTALARASRLERVPDLDLTLESRQGTRIVAAATFAPAVPPELGVFVILREANGAASDPHTLERLQLEQRAARLHAATLDSLPAHVALLDASGRITAVNEAWRRFARENGLGDRAYCVGEDYLAVCRLAAGESPEAAAMLAGIEEVLNGSRSAFELEYPCHGLERRWFRAHVSAVRAPFAAGAVVMHLNVTDRHLADEKARRASHALYKLSKAAAQAENEYRDRLDHVSRHDALTGLVNRSVLESFVRQAIGSAAGQPGVCALMLIDIDRFRQLNESLGYARADALLLEIAARLRAAVPHGDLIARLADDEFAVMFAGLPDTAAVRTHAAGIRERLSAPIALESGPLSLTASIGFSCYPGDGADFDELFRSATVALRTAKKGGGNSFRAYERSMALDSAERLSLQGEIAAAVRTGQFVLLYQPTVDLRTRAPRSVEALVRWRHPTRGLLTPDKFIALAEESGAIIELGDWVLQRACEDAVRLRAAVGAPISMAVNLSARQFERPDLGARIAQALRLTGLEPASLRLELTETTVMSDPAASCAILSELASMGISLALDDFGTGYSSLGYLQQFPLTCLKIDRSFVAKLPGDERAAAITRTVVLLGKALRMNVVAEGVENAAQLEFLRASGCDEIQGYLLAKPLPYEQALEWIAAGLSARTGR